MIVRPCLHLLFASRSVQSANRRSCRALKGHKHRHHFHTGTVGGELHRSDFGVNCVVGRRQTHSGSMTGPTWINAKYVYMMSSAKNKENDCNILRPRNVFIFLEVRKKKISVSCQKSNFRDESRFVEVVVLTR